MKTTTSKRLTYIMEAKKLRQVDILEKAKPICEKYGVKLNRNDLSQYVSGKVEPGQKKLSILSLTLNVSEAWLMGYDVPMERTENKSSNFATTKDKIVEKLELLTEEQKEKVSTYIDGLIRLANIENEVLEKISDNAPNIKTAL